ncbi:MAG: hypothetical protein IKV87_03050 [Methanobrevibacter sp.]|nr:hypothetical protein [Methanobrevibacter sp.]
MVNSDDFNQKAKLKKKGLILEEENFRKAILFYEKSIPFFSKNIPNVYL